MKNVNKFTVFVLSLLLVNSNVFAMKKRIKSFLPSKSGQKANGSRGYRPTFKERLSRTPGLKRIVGPSKQLQQPTDQQPSITKFFTKDKFGKKYQSWAGSQGWTTQPKPSRMQRFKQKLGFKPKITPDQVSQKGQLSVEERVTAFPKQMQQKYPKQATGIAMGTMGLGKQALKSNRFQPWSIKEERAGKVDPTFEAQRIKAAKTYLGDKKREADYLNPAIRKIKMQEGLLPPVPTAPKPTLKRQYQPRKRGGFSQQQQNKPLPAPYKVIQPTTATPQVKTNLLGN